MGSFVSHLECSLTGETYPAREARGLSPAGGPLLVRYDLAALGGAASKEAPAARADGVWRWRDFLPVEMEKNRISLGEAVTPLIRMQRIEALRGGGALFVKDESRLPAGTATARGFAVAVSMAKELRVKRLAMAAEDADGATLAAYAARAGLSAAVFCPLDTDPDIIDAIAIRGADVHCVNGSIDDCRRIVREGTGKAGWFDVTPHCEPYFVDGMKTAGLELAEQFAWDLPDWIFHPADAGVAGLSKAFDELEAIGWIGAKRPHLVAVAAGAADDKDSGDAFAEMAREEGLLLAPRSAAAFAAYKRAVFDRRIGRGERVVLFNSAAGARHPAAPATAVIDPHAPIDYTRFKIDSSGDD